MELFILSVISLAWQGTGWGADALAGPHRADPAALTLGLSSNAVLNQNKLLHYKIPAKTLASFCLSVSSLL